MKIHSQTIRKFPDGIKSFPTELMSESHAQKIHSQSLKRLDERGGMGYHEIMINIFGRELIEVSETKAQGELLERMYNITKLKNKTSPFMLGLRKIKAQVKICLLIGRCV